MSGRELRAWLVAAGVHAALFALASSEPPRAPIAHPPPPKELPPAGEMEVVASIESRSNVPVASDGTRSSDIREHDDSDRAGPQEAIAMTARRASGVSSRRSGARDGASDGEAAGSNGDGGDAPNGSNGDDDWSEPSNDDWLARATEAARLPFALAPAPAAPTKTPRREPITARDTNEAVRSGVRHRDRALGLGNREQTAVASAVQTAGRATGLPNGTRFAVEVDVDRSGNVLGVRLGATSGGDEVVWKQFLEDTRAGLPAKLDIGTDLKEAGGRVVANAVLLHIFPSGSDKRVIVGECPKMPTATNEAMVGFFWLGGSPYGDLPTGTCFLGDTADLVGEKQIVVRTSVQTFIPNDAPPPVDTLPAKPRKRQKLVDPMEFGPRPTEVKRDPRG